MKSLLAWEQLKQSETRPGQSPAFTVRDPIETDLRDEYSFFLSTSVEMHAILNDLSVNTVHQDRLELKKKLIEVEHQVYSLDLAQRFGQVTSRQ